MTGLAEVAAPDEEGLPKAPIHLIFYDKLQQTMLLDALSRHFASIVEATPLFDFITQLAAFDSPVATFLEDEIRELKNYPMVCQSLQAVAHICGSTGTSQRHTGGSSASGCSISGASWSVRTATAWYTTDHDSTASSHWNMPMPPGANWKNLRRPIRRNIAASVALTCH